jgi:hypothetical protein
MSTLGIFHCWDDAAQHPTRPVGAAPSQGSEETHLHIHIGDDALPRKGRDANAGGRGEANPAGRRNGRLRDQGEDPSEQPDCDPLIARIRQSGDTGEWSGELADDGGENGEGSPLKIKQDPQGGLLIHHALAENGEGMDANAEKLGLKRPLGSATLDSYRAFDDRALDQLQRTGSTEYGYAASRAFAAKMSAAFRPKNR